MNSKNLYHLKLLVVDNEISSFLEFSHMVVQYGHSISNINSSGNFCCLLITFANSLDLDQNRADLDPNHLTLVFLKRFFGKRYFEISDQMTILPSIQKLAFRKSLVSM